MGVKLKGRKVHIEKGQGVSLRDSSTGYCLFGTEFEQIGPLRRNPVFRALRTTNL